VDRHVERDGKSNTQMVARERSATVILHKNETVSVGISGGDPERRNSTREVVEELNHRYPSNPPTYRMARGEVPVERLSRAAQDPSGRSAPQVGVCSEAIAAVAAGENGSPPIAFQTIWAGQSDPPSIHQFPTPTRIGGDGAPLMLACRTCLLNRNTYNSIAGR
jgi:hypothetical protein